MHGAGPYCPGLLKQYPNQPHRPLKAHHAHTPSKHAAGPAPPRPLIRGIHREGPRSLRRLALPRCPGALHPRRRELPLLKRLFLVVGGRGPDTPAQREVHMPRLRAGRRPALPGAGRRLPGGGQGVQVRRREDVGPLPPRRPRPGARLPRRLLREDGEAGHGAEGRRVAAGDCAAEARGEARRSL